MAVQIRHPDGSLEWLRGEYCNGGKDGFTVWDRHANPRHGQHTDFGNEYTVVSLTPDDNVTDWSRRYSDPGGGTGNGGTA